jgi:hypothetical protein
MYSKYFRHLIVILYYLLLSQFTSVITIAQKVETVIQIDTVRVANIPASMIFIIKIDTSMLDHKYSFGSDLITHIELYEYINNLLVQTINDTSESNSFAGGVNYVDINLDGYLDLDIDLGVSNLTPFHSFWLYDQLKNKFYHSPEFSQLNDYSIDFDKKEIDSYSQSTGGRGGYNEKYKVGNGKLYLIGTEYSNFYDYEKKELVNGVLKVVSKEEPEDIKDKNGNYIKLIKTYNLVNDSLLLTKKSWLVDAEGEDLNKYDSDTYYCSPWGECLKYLRKEIYSYDKNDGQLSTKILKYQVFNNKWKKVKDFKR